MKNKYGRIRYDKSYQLRFLSFLGGFSFSVLTGMPVWALLVAISRKEFFKYDYAIEVIVLAAWILSIVMVSYLTGIKLPRIKRVGLDGIELDHDRIKAIEPGKAF